MNCGQIEELLPAYMEEDLGGRQLQEVKLHLESCAACRRERDLLLRSWEMLDAWQPVEPAPQLRAQVWEKIRLAPPPSLWERLRSKVPAWTRGLVLGLCCMAVLVGGYTRFHHTVEPATPQIVAQVAPLEEAELAFEWNPGVVEDVLGPAEEPPLEDAELPVGELSRDWMDGAHNALGDVLGAGG